MQTYNAKDVAPHILHLFKKVIAMPHGKDALKRLCIFCGICKSKKFYSLTRQSLKIADTHCCDSCYNIYDLTEASVKLDCKDHEAGGIFLSGNFISTKCKSCRILQILSKCEIPTEKYDSLYNSLSKPCQELVSSSSQKTAATSSASSGFLRLQYYVGDKWLDMGDSQVDDDSSMDVDSSSDHFSEAREESDTVDTNPPSPEDNEDNNSEENGVSMDIYEEEAMVDDPPALEEEPPVVKEILTTRQIKIKENLAFSVKSSDRIRKKKKVDYIVGKKYKKCVHGPDGKILKNGKDLCDCLQNHCPGCHFPCPKCRNPKCGSDCRVNRRWYYDKVDIEGTNISWTNKWVQKLN